jgi:hypothetical protein
MTVSFFGADLGFIEMIGLSVLGGLRGRGEDGKCLNLRSSDICGIISLASSGLFVGEACHVLG